MNLAIADVNDVSSSGLCIGCGTCCCACPTNAIAMARDGKRGIYVPRVDEVTCTRCLSCLKVCPGLEVNFEDLTREVFNAGWDDPLLGHYVTTYVGHAANADLRRRSSSGGLVTALLVAALESGQIDAALVTRMNRSEPLEPEVFVARSKAEIISAMGSKYCPVNLNGGLRNALEACCSLAVVGLPCHVHGIRKLASADTQIRSRVRLCLGLFCASCPTFLGTEYFLRRYGIKREQVVSFDYRGRGWPGKITIGLKDGREQIIDRGNQQASFVRRLIYTSAFHYDFVQRRCLLCPDHFNVLADVSLGDAWLPELLNGENEGASAIVTRSYAGDELVKAALAQGDIEVTRVDPDCVTRSQNVAYKLNSYARVRLARALGRPVPMLSGMSNGRSSQGPLKSALPYALSYVSHARALWPAIHMFAILRGLTVRTGLPILRRCQDVLRPVRRNPDARSKVK